MMKTIGTLEELLEFVNSIDWEKSAVVLKESGEDKCDCGDACKCGDDCKCGDNCSCNEEKIEESEITTVTTTTSSEGWLVVESLSNDPKFPLILSEENVNIFHVKDFEATAGACGNGTVVLDGRVSHMNMCESDDVATVDLTIVVEGKRLSNIPFILRKTDKEPYIELSKEHLT